jgi:hypothetical protein
MPGSRSAFPPLTSELRSRFVTQVAKTVRELYVLEDKASVMADHLLAKHAAGAFDEIDAIPKLAARLTQELHGVHEDLHLYIDPWLPPEDGSDEGNLHEDMLRTKHRTNFDFRKLEVLLGNIGYMDLRMFCPVRMSGKTAAAAMQFLAHADALVFDLRDNGGGEDLVQFLQSYLFDKPTHMITQRHRSGKIKQTWTHPFVPGPKFVDHPVYILISRSTFSAGEDFAFTLQRQGRAVIVGEKTRGGAHPVEFYRFPDLFLEIMIPEEASEDPVSGDNWEDSGVVPDIVVHADDALQAAHAAALRKLLEKPEDDESLVGFRRWALESVEAQASRPVLAPDQLRIYPGRYGRSIEVFLEDGILKLNWGKRRDHALLPLQEHVFEFDEGTQRAYFVVEDGAVTELVGRDQAGGEWRLPRRD